MRKFINQGCEDIYLLRNGLIHRSGALIFHVEVLQNMINDVRKDALENPFDFRTAGKDLIYTLRLSYLFDDLVFNIMSFHDYLASFIGYIIYDKEIRSLAKGYNPLKQNEENVAHLRGVLYKMSWTKIAEMSKAGSNKKFLKFKGNKFYDTELSEVISVHDGNFIEGLSRYRNRLIHNENDSPNLNLTFSFSNANEVKFFTPPSFEKYFNKSPDNFEKAINLLISNFADSIEQIFDALGNYIESNRRVEKGKEFAQYKHELDQD